MSSESQHSKPKSRRDYKHDDDSDKDRFRRKRRHDRYEDDEIRKRDKKKESKKRDRDSEKRSSSRREYSESDSGGERKSSSKHRHRRDRKSKSSSHKRRKKSSKRSDNGYDSYSDYSSDYDRDYDRERLERKRKKKSSSKSASRSSSRKHDKKDKAKSKPDKSKLYPMGEPLGHPPETKIDAQQDYFSYHNEFWIYLFREEGICFNDLETVQAREAFGRFAKNYNAGKLEEPYYTRSFPNAVIEESKTTKHSWGFKTTTAERKGLDDLQKGIRRQTEYSEKKSTSQDVRNLSLQSNQVSCAPVESLQRSRFPRTAEERTQQKRDDKKWKDRVKLTHEELSGGSKDFRERQLEKKRELSAKIHGAHRDKESAGVELSDAALYGQDRDSLEATRARLSQSKERRKAKQNNRIQELQAKEEERKNNMLKMLGLENLQGKKLEIAPRK